MADIERNLLNHYNLTTLYPIQWPADKDEDDAPEDEKLPVIRAESTRKARSRYSALERDTSIRSKVPGSQRGKDGVETMVQKDESDPLTGAGSVVQILRQRGLPVEENLRLSENGSTAGVNFV